MAVVRYVAFYPPTGFVDRRWADSAACDSLVRTARRVAGGYSAAIERHRLDGNASEVRVFVRDAPPGQTDVTVEVNLEFFETFESAVALVPASVAALSPRARAEVALRVLTGVVAELAPHRGWTASALAEAEAEVRAADLQFEWSGPWKSAPDRRREARAWFWFEDDGFGRAVIEVRPRGVDDAPVARSAPALAFCTAAGFARAAGTLRWRDGTLTMHPFIGLLGVEGDAMRFDPDVDADSGRVGPAPDGALDAVPDVMVTGRRRSSDPEPIVFVGGGPMNDVPDAYDRVLCELMHRLVADGGDWWAPADRPRLEIVFDISDATTDVRVRRLATHVKAVIRRSLPSLLDGDPAQAARDDVAALVEAVSRRMGLVGRPLV